MYKNYLNITKNVLKKSGNTSNTNNTKIGDLDDNTSDPDFNPLGMDLESLEPFNEQQKKEIYKYAAKNQILIFDQLYDKIKALNNPNIKYKVKVIKHDPSSLYDAVFKGNWNNFAKESGIVNYFFNTNMLQVSGNNKVYKVFSMCTANPIY